MAINEFGGAATLGNPAGIVTGPDGNLWFTELSPTVNAIGRITPSGAIQQFSTGLSSFAVATGIAAGPDNALWFTEYGDPSSLQLGITSGDKIGRIGVDGTITEYPLPVDPLTSQPRVGRPDFIALGTDGALWFTEHDGNRIGRIDPASKAITEFPIPTANSEPAGITSGPDGALWFTETNTDKIGRIDPATGQITEFGLPGGDNNRSPLGITSGPDNNLWFTESGSANNPLGGIGKITTDGVVTEFIAGQTPGLTPGAAPAGIVTGPDLNLYFTEANTGRLGRITTAGAVTELPLPGSQAQPTASPIPLLAGITVGPDGNLWAAATLSSRIIRSSTEGVAVPFPAATSIDPGNAVIGIASGSDGALWFTETVVTGTTPKIGRIDLAGTITEFSTNLPSNADPRSIAAGSDGALWFTDRGTNSIGRITTTGQITEFPIPAAGGSASTPESITPGPDGALWFTNAAITDFGSSPVGTGFIGRITTDGVISTFASKLPVGGFQGRHTQGITAGPDGNLWFTDSTGGASFIGVITLAGAITTFPVSNSEESAGDITAGPDGALYFTEDDGLHGNIGRITTAGVITQIPVDQPGPFAVPTGIVLGPDRLLYFLNRNTDPNSPYSNSVVRINADGSFTTLPIPTAEAAPLGMAVGPEGNLYFTEGAVFFQDSVQPPVSQIGQVVLPQASVTERPVGDLLLGGAGETYSGIFASFTEDSGAATPANFAATIDYGDGQGGPGVVTRAPGQPTDVGPITYFVSGSHTFATAGTFRVTTTVFNQAGISTSTFITVVVPGAVTGSPIVTNLNDAGPGSLRQAILIANQAPGQTIVFNIPAALADPTTGLFSIRPTSPLPGLLTTTFVDGTTQAAFLGRPTASILVEVVGLNAAPSDGIVFGPDSDGSLLKSLAVYGFAGSQVRIEGDFDQVFSCYVGISADASARIGLANFLVTAASNPGSDGILVHGSHAMIGSASPGFGNVVSGNRGQGIEFAGAGAFFGQVYGNYVGTDPTGLAAIPNLLDGIVIGPGATAINIQSNLISGNVGVGLEFLATSGNVALANMIGTDATGAAPLGNGGAGVCLDASSTGNQIGRFDSTVGNALVNVISGNKQQGVLIQGGSTGNFVFGNLIGTSKDGLREVHNGVGGVMLVGVSGNMVGPNNVISGNVGNGVEFLGASGNMLAGNLVGTDATGMAALGNSGSGVCLDQGSTGNTIGGVGLTAGNVISGNKLNGLAIQSFSNNNIVLGNKFGTDMLGTGRVGNLQSGVFLTRANGNLIGPGNVSSGNGAFGIELLGASGNIIAGNFIGTDASGQAGLGNAVTGICVDLGSNANLIGGMTADSRNVISSNAVVGVAIQGGSIANMVLGNRIGTNVDGTKALGNGIAGVLISESSDNLVGFGNVISGNGSAATPGAGIWVDGLGSTGNQLVANFVGTNFDGSSKLPNNAVGILLNDAPRNIVGGTSPLASNVISGNSLVGLMISGDGATGNLVLGNKIGTDVTGARKVGNGGATQGVGLYLLGAGGNTIGGTTLDLANVISGNSFDGVELFGPGSTGNVIQGNLIGLDASGTRPLGNGDDGIVFDEAPRNLVLSNYIGSNARNGIFVSGSAGNVLRLNAIGVGVGGQALGNGTFGILIGNNSVGTVEVANLNFNNGIGPERNTDTGVTATSSAPATTAAQKSGGKSATKAKSNAKAVKVQATAKAFASRPLKSLQARGHWKS